MQFFDGLLVVAEIFLAADEDDGKALAEVKNLGDPLLFDDPVSMFINQANKGFVEMAHLFLDVVKGVWGIDGEADENYMRVGI